MIELEGRYGLVSYVEAFYGLKQMSDELAGIWSFALSRLKCHYSYSKAFIGAREDTWPLSGQHNAAIMSWQAVVPYARSAMGNDRAVVSAPLGSAWSPGSVLRNTSPADKVNKPDNKTISPL